MRASELVVGAGPPEQAPALALEALPPVGVAAPVIDRSGFAGRVVLVHFFATWCEPCREELPALNRLSTRHADTTTAILGVDVGEGDPKVRRFMETTPVKFPILMDRDRSAARAWDVTVLPSTFLIGPDGHLRARSEGPVEWDRPEAEAVITGLLATQAIGSDQIPQSPRTSRDIGRSAQ
ncbi:TlpA disulfide reductase family protein [Xanthobacter sp. DSM 24535]|uniref:TlpA family protein disulfide reductase n=1 Tax=Roseixanthobacter psychrophilus TaxID=3119917 RepID=UPI0037269F36